MWWPAADLAALDAALVDCRAGRPTTLLVSGEAGIGKSALIDELAARASGFAVVRAEGSPSVAAPYEVLDQLGVRMDAAPDVLSRPFAAQCVRAWLDELLTRGPVLVVIDDAQWADPESMAALVAVMNRALAEQVLLCIAIRPLEANQHPDLQRWAARTDRVLRLKVTGLEVDAALAMLAELRPTLPPEVGRRIWEHVGGNPLYLRALAEEHDPATLIRTSVLPAPAQFSAAVAARLARLSAGARQFGFAAAVLDDTWRLLRDVAAVAGVADAAEAADEVVAAALMLVRTGEGGSELRFGHALIRAAVYQHIPVATRRALHLRAAAVVQGDAGSLEHRLAAAVDHDDRLADDLEAYAGQQRNRRHFGLAARYLRLAASVTSDRVARERRWLDSLFDSVLALDRKALHEQHDALSEAADRRRRDLVLGGLASSERRPHEAVRILQPWSGNPTETDRVQYRLEAMLAWARLMADAPESEIAEALDRAERLRLADDPMERVALLVRAQLVTRHSTGVPDPQSLPDDARLVPLSASGALSWRGTVNAYMGQFDRAIRDLLEVTERMQRGHLEFSSGTFHAVLATAQWFAGDWGKARLNIRTARELSGPYLHPIVAAATPLVAIGEGALHEADAQLQEARDLLRSVPWREAVDQLTVATIARAHADGRPGAAPFAQIESTVEDVLAGRVTKSIVWTTHAALAAVWAGRQDVVSALCTRLDAAAGRAPWRFGIAEWLRGLATESGGSGKAALGHLAAATSADLSALPLYRAHVHADHARVAHLVQGDAAARRSLGIATDSYRSLGARVYLERILAVHDDPASTTSANAERILLSDRERDVLTLVVSGMSYAQMARDLFITRSTVSFHLGNIYAKANVGSRHELTDLARSHPALFGLSTLQPVTV
jgi:DNA-binding CsgD family transcriptional regulator